MRAPSELARLNINCDDLLVALRTCLRIEHPPIEEPLPNRLAALLDQLQALPNRETD